MGDQTSAKLAPGPAPLRVFCTHSAKDADLYQEFLLHLQPHLEAGLLELVTVAPGEFDPAKIEAWNKHPDPKTAAAAVMERADVVVICMSPHYLAANDYQDMEALAKQWSLKHPNGVLPIYLRPCDWQETIFAKHNPIPKRPVSEHSDRVPVYEQLIREILRVIPLDAIFKTNGPPDLSFVEPAQLPYLVAQLSNMGRGLVVEGPSGIGKTTAVRYAIPVALERLRFTPALTWLDGKKADAELYLKEILGSNFQQGGYLAIDDFHRLEYSLQKGVANLLKTLSDDNRRDTKVILIGVGSIGTSLEQALPELAGRFTTVRMGRQPDSKIDELIRKGESAANIQFRERALFVQEAAGSFFTAQMLCYEACEQDGIDGIQPQVRIVARSPVGGVVDSICDRLAGKYRGGICALAAIDEYPNPRGAGAALLWLLRQSPNQSVSMTDARYAFPQLADAFSWLAAVLPGQLAKDPLNRMFYYRPEAGTLSIDDPQLDFYLRHLDWSAFLHGTAHVGVRWKPDVGLVFDDAPAHISVQVDESSSSHSFREYSTEASRSAEEAERKNMSLIRILFLAANPSDKTRLELPREAQEIDDRLRSTDLRDAFRVEQQYEVRADQLPAKIMRFKPKIVHFSGHGDATGALVFQDRNGQSSIASREAIANVFALLGADIRCVILNACFTSHQADAIAEHVDVVIGMSRAIHDKDAIIFAGGFYEALGYGKDVLTAFELAKLKIDLSKLPDKDVPQIRARRGVDLKQLVLVSQS